MFERVFRASLRSSARVAVLALIGGTIGAVASCVTGDSIWPSHCHPAHCGRVPDSLLCADGEDVGITGRCMSTPEGCAWETAPCSDLIGEGQATEG